MTDPAQVIEHDKAMTEEPDIQPTIHAPRNAVIAALLSAILPGFGQIYNGQINKSLWIFLSFCLLTIPLIVIIALYLPVGLTTIGVALSTALTLLVWLCGIADAWRNARRLGNYRLKPWQTSGMYVVTFLVCNMLILPSVFLWVRDHQVQSFYIPSHSMAPTVLKGDVLFANKNYNCPNCRTHVSRGDVAVFVYPNNRTQHYIKRVIGLAGDKVSITALGVSVNGKLLGEISSQGETTESLNNRSWNVIWGNDELIADNEFTVTPGHAFVLGDNRSKSNDSRDFGMVPLSDIVALSRQVWFSKGQDGIRWSRLGTDLQPRLQ